MRLTSIIDHEEHPSLMAPLGITFIKPDPPNAKFYAIGGAVVGGVLGGWFGKHAGLIAGTIGGALSLGFIAWFYFSGRGVPTVAQIEQSVAGNVTG